MADTTFSAGTTITSTWLNEINDDVYFSAKNLVRVGAAVADSSTDNTTTIYTYVNADTDILYYIPPKVKFTRKTLLQNLTRNVSFIDHSHLNDYTATGETTRHIGMLSKSTAPNDAHFSIDDDHHSIIALNNYGTSGSTSASERKASFVWNCGQYALGASDKRGWRGGAMLQFTKESSSNFWVLNLRSLAPWEALNGEYEEWAAGQTISGAGVYRTHASNHYVSTGAGTTGATSPTHSSGTVSDGGVSWTYLDSGDRSIFFIDQYGRYLINNATFNGTFTHKALSTDPSGGAYTFEGLASGASKPATLKLTPTNSGSSSSAQPYFQALDGSGLQVLTSSGSASIYAFTDNGIQKGLEGLLSAPSTLASASSITVTRPVHFVSGTTTISTISVPTIMGNTGGQITLIPTGLWSTNTAGNIALATTAVVNKALIMTYDTASNKWYPSY